jgi:uncharacterized protein YcfJ
LEKSKKIGATVVQVMDTGYTRIEINNDWGDSISVEEAQQICQTIFDLNNGNKMGSVIIGTNATGVHMESGVNQVFSKNELLNKVRIAEAQVFDSLPQRLLIHFYHKMNRNKNFKVFKNEELAVEWILDQIEQDKN